VMARTGRQFVVAHGGQFPTQGLRRQRDPELLEHPLAQRRSRDPLPVSGPVKRRASRVVNRRFGRIGLQIQGA
jgi:hypothetical protein